MNLNIRFKGFEASTKIKEYVENRGKKLGKFLPPTINLNVTLTEDKTRKVAEFNLHHKGVDYVASQTSGNMYTSIDEAVDKLTRQLSRNKDKKHARGINPAKTMEMNDLELESD